MTYRPARKVLLPTERHPSCLTSYPLTRHTLPHTDIRPCIPGRYHQRNRCSRLNPRNLKPCSLNRLSSKSQVQLWA
jgi:hypothetical protein